MKRLELSEFDYTLPQEKIALFPLEERDRSRLLVYQAGSIHHRSFTDLPSSLPTDSFLFFNNTRVIPARLIFSKATGAQVEVFLLDPVRPSTLVAEAMAAASPCTWRCTIGNLKRWPSGTTLALADDGITLNATLIDGKEQYVEFSWGGDASFAQIVQRFGNTPLPPYLKRKPAPGDVQRYQTIYSRPEGAVAAPTAGLHFTDRVFRDMSSRGIRHDFLTLHVSAGTFQPIKTKNVDEHPMHREQIIVTRSNIENLLARPGSIIAVGTTSMRTLESIYWYGVRLLENKTDFSIGQDFPYEERPLPETGEALRAVIRFIDESGKDHLAGDTAIFIKPGYRFRVCRGLITNFHQPASTLILLVAAFVGEDWKKIYAEALRNDYRFLSYGDSSLLLP